MEFENARQAHSGQSKEGKDSLLYQTPKYGISPTSNSAKPGFAQNTPQMFKFQESNLKISETPSYFARENDYSPKDHLQRLSAKDEIREAINTQVREIVLREIERQNSAEIKAMFQSGQTKAQNLRPFSTITSARLDSRSNMPRHDLMVDPCCFDRHCSRRKSGTVYEAIIREQREAILTSARRRSESRPESKRSTPSRSRSKGNKPGQNTQGEPTPTTRTIIIESNREMDAWTPRPLRVSNERLLRQGHHEYGEQYLQSPSAQGSKVLETSWQGHLLQQREQNKAMITQPSKVAPYSPKTHTGERQVEHQRLAQPNKTSFTQGKENAGGLGWDGTRRQTASYLTSKAIGRSDYRGNPDSKCEAAQWQTGDRMSLGSLLRFEPGESQQSFSGTLTQVDVDKLESRFAVVAQEVKKGLSFLVNTQNSEHKGQQWEQSSDLVQQLESLKAYTKSLELQNREKDVEILNLCVNLQDLSKATREILRKVRVRK